MKIILFAALGLLTGCASESPGWRESVLWHSQNVRQQARVITVDPKDGISEVEAYRIGTDRFETYKTSCGMTDIPKDFGERWRVTTLVGYAGEPFEYIWIRKSDGLVTYERVR